MTKKRKIFEQIVKTKNEDGTLKSINHTILKSVPRDKFIQVYLEDIRVFMDLPDASSIKVLVNLWKYCTCDTNEIIIVKALKERIADNVGIKLQSVSNIISKLVKKKILIRRNTSIYILNPLYFFKGRDFTRQNLIRLIVEYELTDVEQDGTKGMYADSKTEEYYAYFEKKLKEKKKEKEKKKKEKKDKSKKSK